MKTQERLLAVVFVVAGSAMGLVFLCIAPFAAVATLAARTLSRRVALATIVAMWAIDQIAGFGWLHYPRDASTFAWGAAMLAASLVAGLTATRVRPFAFAFVAAFAAFELVLFAWSLVVGERGAFGARVVVQVFAGNAFGLAILAALRTVVHASGRLAARSGAITDARR